MLEHMDVRSERRIVTCLFIDVVGSTDLMMRLGPEVMRRRLADAFDQMSATIVEHGGTVENFAGDAIFSIFGAPTAHVDDPLRALRAAHACAEWSAKALGTDRLSIRVGIETGDALVDLAAVERRDRMAIGACVNVAARLQQQASLGEIVVGPTFHSNTVRTVAFEPLGLLELKGLGSIEAWRFVDFATEGSVPSVPFVGRQAELELLNEAAERAAKGSATIALIVGSPGLGKSRLVEELIRRRRKLGRLRVIEVRCRPAGEDGANTPLRQLIEADAPKATPESVRDRLSALMGAEEASPVATAIVHSAGLSADAEFLATSRYEQRETIAESWRRYLTALSRDEPLMIAVEDLQWADPVLVRMIDHVTSGADASLLVVATARPEFVGSAHIRPAENRVQIDLEPLTADAAEELARQARGTVLGLERAAGNPLFIIELARARAATGDLPPTIQAAIAARLDELSPDERQLLQYAAVAGETFDVRDAALLADREPAEVAGMLGRIAHLRFIEAVGQAYRFHHALVRDVAYGRLPVTTRFALHARYAEQGVAPTDAEGRAFHLWEAVKPPDAEWVWEEATRLEGLRAAAFDAQLAAGARLEDRNQYEQAEEAYRRALQLATDPQRLATAHADLGRALARQGRGDEAWTQRLLALDEFAQARTAPPSRLYADMLEIATMNWGYFRELPADAEVGRLLEEGQRNARASGDNVSLARLLMQHAAFTGDASATDEVMAFVNSPDAVRFADPAHRTAEILMWNGQLGRSVKLYQRVFDELLPNGAIINEPEALIWYGLAAFHAGELKLAESLAARAQADLAKGRSIHTQQHVLGLRSLVEFGSGDWEKLHQTTLDLEQLVASNPDAPFCLVGAGAVGYGACGRLMSGAPPGELKPAVARMVAESELVQAASILLPNAMLSDIEAVEAGLAAYVPGLRLWDRAAAWDVCHLMPAVAATVLERSDMAEGPLARLDACAAGGSRLATAVATAIREEAAAKGSGPQHDHSELRQLGYLGISDLLRFRATRGRELQQPPTR